MCLLFPRINPIQQKKVNGAVPNFELIEILIAIVERLIACLTVCVCSVCFYSKQPVHEHLPACGFCSTKSKMKTLVIDWIGWTQW